jgi:hypothetical protein
MGVRADTTPIGQKFTELQIQDEPIYCQKEKPR